MLKLRANEIYQYKLKNLFINRCEIKFCSVLELLNLDFLKHSLKHLSFMNLTQIEVTLNMDFNF